MITTNRRPARGRVKPREATPVMITTITPGSSTLSVTVDQPVIIKGTPQWTLNIAGNVINVAVISPTEFQVNFDASVMSAAVVNIPFQDPSIRNAVGGYIAQSAFPLS